MKYDRGRVCASHDQVCALKAYTILGSQETPKRYSSLIEEVRDHTQVIHVVHKFAMSLSYTHGYNKASHFELKYGSLAALSIF